jgi:hypothetical protein
MHFGQLNNQIAKQLTFLQLAIEMSHGYIHGTIIDNFWKETIKVLAIFKKAKLSVHFQSFLFLLYSFRPNIRFIINFGQLFNINE